MSSVPREQKGARSRHKSIWSNFFYVFDTFNNLFRVIRTLLFTTVFSHSLFGCMSVETVCKVGTSLRPCICSVNGTPGAAPITKILGPLLVTAGSDP